LQNEANICQILQSVGILRSEPARFACEYRDGRGSWHRAYGNESWEINPDGLIFRRIASSNDHAIAEGDRMFLWPLGRRPDDYPELNDFDF